MASSKQKATLWLIIAGVFGWTVYKMSGGSFEKMMSNTKTALGVDKIMKKAK